MVNKKQIKYEIKLMKLLKLVKDIELENEITKLFDEIMEEL